MILDQDDEPKWHDHDDGLEIDYPLICTDCDAVLTLHARATGITIAEG